MCTAITYQTKDHYFGRNMDFEYSYEETVTVTPRKYQFHFQKAGNWDEHYAMIGMAYVVNDYPLYYDATNEKGLSMAGLYFPGNAEYKEWKEGMENVASYELIPWILGQCATISEVRNVLAHTNVWKLDFSKELPAAPLHWMIADQEQAVTLEVMQDEMHIYDNVVGVLTNNPPFDYQMMHLNQYRGLSSEVPENRFHKQLSLPLYSRGMGAIGLPGDLSSSSRFVRAAFVKWNSVTGEEESESISQFFHILNAVEQQRGCVRLDSGEYERTIYSSCCNVDKGVYYYTTYDNRQITAVDMYKTDLEEETLFLYPLQKEQQIKREK